MVAGVYGVVSTHGIPLEVVLEVFKSQGRVMDVVDYVLNALREGYNAQSLKTKLIAAYGDVYGSKWREAIKERLDILYT